LRECFLRRYERFKKAIETLRIITKLNVNDIINDYIMLSALERNIHVAVEFLIDLSSYILSELGSKIPDTYKGIVSNIGEECNMDENLIKEIRGVIGLRNIIVHLYADVDYDLVLKDLNEIIDNMLKYVKKLIECMKEKGIDP